MWDAHLLFGTSEADATSPQPVAEGQAQQHADQGFWYQGTWYAGYPQQQGYGQQQHHGPGQQQHHGYGQQQYQGYGQQHHQGQVHAQGRQAGYVWQDVTGQTHVFRTSEKSKTGFFNKLVLLTALYTCQQQHLLQRELTRLQSLSSIQVPLQYLVNAFQQRGISAFYDLGYLPAEKWASWMTNTNRLKSLKVEEEKNAELFCWP